MDHMSKHPGPWSMRNNFVTDAHGEVVADVGEVVADDCNLVDTIDEQGNLLVSSDDARRLILAAPELLAELKRVNEYVDGGLDPKAMDLIDRIEKGST
jgi:hypothetical protein